MASVFHCWLRVDSPKPRKPVDRRFSRSSTYQLVVQSRPNRSRNRRYKEAEEAFAKDLNFSQTLRVFILPRCARYFENRPAQARTNAQLENEGYWRDYAVAWCNKRKATNRPPTPRSRISSPRIRTAAHFRSLCSTQFGRNPSRCSSGSNCLWHAGFRTDSARRHTFFLPYRDDPRFTALCQKLNVQLPATSTKP